ncbi:hypothetical protein [Sulfuricurvum sp.]|uniref:hypothetical protein n=1 Tax=Sulfuricurvum sp. TaxID=2025608 RepID=UPI0026386C08|nr:hypothetical protein [Sulfuricurvum sp.]MDD2267038.1 hypothetical protein [Sulfuricurvum sp.]MDD2785069.1 hypothetical protein [Sulfuricurvum sp.]
MSKAPSYAPIIRRVKNGSVTFEEVEYHHEALEPHSGSDVFCDMEVDVETEKCCYRIYDAWENEICVIELKTMDTIEEAVNVKK